MINILLLTLLTLFIIMFDICIYLLIDYFKIRIIKFKPDGSECWYIAFSEKDLHRKLNGRMATVIIPSQPILKRIWIYYFPPKIKNIETNRLLENK